MSCIGRWIVPRKRLTLFLGMRFSNALITRCPPNIFLDPDIRLRKVIQTLIELRCLVAGDERGPALADPVDVLNLVGDLSGKGPGLDLPDDRLLHPVEELLRDRLDERDVLVHEGLDLGRHPRLDAGDVDAEHGPEYPVDLLCAELLDPVGVFLDEDGDL